MKKIVVLQLVLFVITALTVVPYGIYYIVGPTGVGDRINIHATVDNALGVGEGTVVTYRGVQAGMVTGIGFDPETRGARIDFALDGDTRIPVDSYAKITQAPWPACSTSTSFRVSTTAPISPTATRSRCPQTNSPPRSPKRSPIPPICSKPSTPR